MTALKRMGYPDGIWRRLFDAIEGGYERRGGGRELSPRAQGREYITLEDLAAPMAEFRLSETDEQMQVCVYLSVCLSVCLSVSLSLSLSLCVYVCKVCMCAKAMA